MWQTKNIKQGICQNNFENLKREDTHLNFAEMALFPQINSWLVCLKHLSDFMAEYT